MKHVSVRTLGESIAVLGVVLSLIFVGMELRQNTIASRSAAFQELGIATAQGWLEMSQNRELSDIVQLASSGPGGYDQLSASDAAILRAYLLSFIRLSETIYLQIEQGLLDEAAFDTLGYGDSTFGNIAVEEAWPDMKPLITPSFASYVESKYDNLTR